jgi:hypothetical protein
VVRPPAATLGLPDDEDKRVGRGVPMASAPVRVGSTSPATAARRSHSFFNDRVIASPLAWSPDSRYLAVLLQTDERPLISTALAVIDPTTMTARTVATGVIRGASFAPSGPDRLVYGDEARSQQIEDAVNLCTVNPDGSDRRQLSADGDSLRPLWTARGIVYDRETRRGVGPAPAYQLWLLHGGHSTQLTHLTPPALVAALVPLAASANGNRLITEYEGPGVAVPLAVQLSPRRVRVLATGGTEIQGAGISADAGPCWSTAMRSPPTRVSSRQSRSVADGRRGSPAATRPPGTADPAQGQRSGHSLPLRSSRGMGFLPFRVLFSGAMAVGTSGR